MNTLITELQRLYFLHDQQWHSQKASAGGEAAYHPEGLLTPAIVASGLAAGTAVVLDLVSADGLVRAMVVAVDARYWEPAAALYLALQNDLNLPAPAVSVSGGKAYGLWFSLAEAIPVAQAQTFLDGLRLTYLSDVPADNLDLRPASGEPAVAVQSVIGLPPSPHIVTGKWSAYIDPSLGSMFMDEPWLEMAPNMDKQADILAGLESIKADDFQQALRTLRPPVLVDVRPLASVDRPRTSLNLNDIHGDPQSFLLAVMNDPSASARQRIAAAKALMPYFHKKISDQ